MTSDLDHLDWHRVADDRQPPSNVPLDTIMRAGRRRARVRRTLLAAAAPVVAIGGVVAVTSVLGLSAPVVDDAVGWASDAGSSQPVDASTSSTEPEPDDADGRPSLDDADDGTPPAEFSEVAEPDTDVLEMVDGLRPEIVGDRSAEFSETGRNVYVSTDTEAFFTDEVLAMPEVTGVPDGEFVTLEVSAYRILDQGPDEAIDWADDLAAHEGTAGEAEVLTAAPGWPEDVGAVHVLNAPYSSQVVLYHDDLQAYFTTSFVALDEDLVTWAHDVAWELSSSTRN